MSDFAHTAGATRGGSVERGRHVYKQVAAEERGVVRDEYKFSDSPGGFAEAAFSGRKKSSCVFKFVRARACVCENAVRTSPHKYK